MIKSRIWRTLEDVVFVIVASTILYTMITGFTESTYSSLMGKGFASELLDPIRNKTYYKTILSILSILTTFFVVLEIIRLLVTEWINFFRMTDDRSAENIFTGMRKIGKEVLVRYKSNFLARVFNEYLSKAVIIFVYLLWMPYFEKFALFKIGNSWYAWLYAYLMWELTYWLWHFAAHRVRLFWCLHAPHHTPSEMNLTVAWVHFFAEGYYTAFVQVPLLMLFGVRPEMVAIILVIDGTWGTFLHAGERSFKNGRFGVLQYLLITPSHHRVHHAKNPLYMDTNFCVLLPFWDWLFGTLQPERKEVKIEYGITRPVDTADFIDFYFGECILLWRDVRLAEGWSNKIKFLFMPPGWTPESNEKTAPVVRKKFLNENPGLNFTSRQFLTRIKI
jgi:sterol desaturase/sphingolipid hydroxylase (fatty acid hydroxylase superfamily)